MKGKNDIDTDNLMLKAMALNQEDFLSAFLIDNYSELEESKETKSKINNNNNNINNKKQEKNTQKNTSTNTYKTNNHNNNNNNNNNISNKNKDKDKDKNKSKKELSDQVFNKLRDLQLLYKKESALRELFTQTSDKIKTNINQYCRDIYKKKLDVQNILQKVNSTILDTEKKKKCILYEDKTFLGNLNNYVPNFFTFLWENPKFLAEILLNSEFQDVKEHLAPFISNNFYENILSFNDTEDYLMYVICILLKDEISKIKTHNDFTKFLCSTVCGCMMNQLGLKSEVQEYFKIILEEVIEQIEMKCSHKKMTFKIKEIEEELQENIENSDKNDKNQDKKKQSKSNVKRKIKKKNDDLTIKKLENMMKNYDTITASSFNMSLSFLNFETDEVSLNVNKLDDKTKEEEFNKKYSPPMTKELLEQLIGENKNNHKIYDYLVLQLKKMGDDKEIYSNKKFVDKANHSEMSKEIWQSYQNDFLNITFFIEKLIDKLNDNLHFLPYPIKCLCKIISILIRKKFPKISSVEENAFISQFFFYNLFVPIFNNPSTGALLNNFIISGNTIHNLNIISYIILQLTSGNFFKNNLKNGDFTFFNIFFLDKIPKFFEFFDKMTKVQLPSFIEKFINDELPQAYKYDYFKENPDKLMFHRTICYSLYDLLALLDNIDNNKKKLFVNENTKIFEKTFEKLNSKTTRNLINTLKKNQKKEIIQKYIPGKGKKPPELKEIEGKKQVYYFLETKLLCNEKYSKLFSITQKTPYFNIKELKKTSSEQEIINNNIIKVKNFFSALLYNYIDLVKKDFNPNSISSIKDILKQLKIFLKYSNFVVDGKIPMEWYATTLIEYLDKIPSNLTDNNCELLFNEIKKDLNKSLKELDFEALSECLGYMKFSQKGVTYYEKAKESLIDIELNNIVKKIIEEEDIPVKLFFKYNQKVKEFKITSKTKDKQIFMIDNMVFEHKQKKPILCETIQIFTKNFPDLSKYKIFQDIDLFQMQEELKIPERIESYFNIIKNHLLENKKFLENQELIVNEEKAMEIIEDKIYDYVMTKIHNKLFPPESDRIDNLIFSKCIKLSWTEPKNFIKEKKNYVYDSFLPDVIAYFKRIEIEKSPRKKLLNMSKIFKSIANLLEFNNGEENIDIGVDDQMPILNYSFIKAQPERIYSNCKYMELYIGDKSCKEEGSQLSQLLGICTYVKDLTYQSLFDVTENEFDENCNKAASNQF